MQLAVEPLTDQWVRIQTGPFDWAELVQPGDRRRLQISISKQKHTPQLSPAIRQIRELRDAIDGNYIQPCFSICTIICVDRYTKPPPIWPPVISQPPPTAQLPPLRLARQHLFITQPKIGNTHYPSSSSLHPSPSSPTASRTPGTRGRPSERP